MKHRQLYSLLFFAALLLLCACFAHGQVSPFMGLGNAQFLDNNGQPLTTGVLYSFQAGTSTQQATYTDSTGLVLNPNPIPFSSGARVGIWLTSTATYKFVLCAQNDGSVCAPADVLFSVDQVPGCLGCSNLGSTFTGTFISGSAIPSTTGILRLASADAICWRNQASTANFCLQKSTSDILSYTGPSFQATQFISTITGTPPFVVASNGEVINLNSNLLEGADWASPGAIGATAPNTGVFTTLQANTSFTLNGATPQTGLQGTDTKLQTAGTNSGTTGAVLCNDSLGGTTTSGCGQVSKVNYGSSSSVCTTSGADSGAGACTTVVNWNSAFADTSYYVTCNGVTFSGSPHIMDVNTLTTTSVTVTIGNGSAAQAVASTYAKLLCIGIHP